MQNLYSKKSINMLIMLFSITYMISYITRINYGAIISEMVSSTGMSKSMLSMALTGSFITYGTGQIISGICGDKFSPKKLVCYGLIVTVLMNVLIPLCNNAYQMLVVWCLNGFAQAFMWPPLIKLMTALFSDEDYKRATLAASSASSVGTIIIYLVSPLLIIAAGWKSVFLFSAICGGIMIIIWSLYCPNVTDKTNTEKQEKIENKHSIASLISPLIIAVMFAIVLQGMLRDGVTTWMPSFISETYNLSNAISILTGVILPLFTIVSLKSTSVLYKRKFSNPMSCSAIVFAIGGLSALFLYFSIGKNALVSVLFSALLVASMHGVNYVLICLVPQFFKKQGNVSTVSGLLNSCTYIGSAISTYGFADVSERNGWGITLLIWLLIALSGALVCISMIKSWKRKFNDK